MKKIYTENAPAPIGPFSQAVLTQNVLFCSGQIGIAANEVALKNGLEDQTKQILANINKVLEAAGLDLTNVAKMTVYLTDMNDFTKMNEVYAAFFGEHEPARTAVEVSKLPLDALVEMECFAVK